MQARELEVDYVIVGAGAVAMSFADTMLREGAATMAIVDRRAKPGGHWNDAYPFVRLHSPAANYGVNSRPLGAEGLEQDGLNRGLQSLASGKEICAYFDALMRERFLPSGRVHFLPEHDYADGEARSLTDGARTRLVAQRRVVDCTIAETRIPATHQPEFTVAPGVLCFAPNALPQANLDAQFVLIGAGKTAMDSAIWLLQRGVEPESITWIRPRDAWLLNRRATQTDFAFFGDTIGALAAEMEAARDAASLEDLFARLEAGEMLRRLDPAVKPEMFRCAIVSDAEFAELKRIRNVVRLGRVRGIDAARIVLAEGEVATSPNHVHVDCTGDGLPKRALGPIFEPGRITPHYVRRCSPTFSGAFIAHIEATRQSDEEKNALCTPCPIPRTPLDWLRMHLVDARNRSAWFRAEQMPWLMQSRLDGYSAMMARAMFEPTPETTAIMERYRAAQKPALSRLAALLKDAEEGVSQF